MRAHNPDQLTAFLGGENIEHHRDAEVGPFLTMGIGGRVRLLVTVRTGPHLESLLTLLHRAGAPYVLLGGGSNVVFADGFSDIIVVVNRTPAMGRVADDLVKVNSGVLIKDFMDWTIAGGIGGMEFLAGIPGTVGGAAAVNAGAFGQSLSEMVQKADIFDRNGEIRVVDRDYFGYTYRDSAFKYSGEVILNVYLRCTPASEDTVRGRVRDNTDYRLRNHPARDVRSAGCFFKNPVINGQKVSAGQLVQEAGFKGTVHRGLEVSPEHANFVINSGDASFRDLLELEQKITGEIAARRGIRLEREVIYISPEGKKY